MTNVFPWMLADPRPRDCVTPAGEPEITGDQSDVPPDDHKVFHGAGNAYAGTDEPYLFGRQRVGGRDPENGSYRSFASFSDPDGNGWLFQEVTTRLPGRIDPATTTFASANDLASALRRAAAAHGQHEARIEQVDPNWPGWYAEYMVREQAGVELPQ